MVDTGTALIVSSFIGSMFMILIMMLNNRNWFKKENFKLNVAAEKLKIKKLAKDLDLSPPSLKTNAGLLDQIKGLDVDKIQDLLSMVQKDQDYEESEDNSISGIINNLIKNNPELVKQYAPELIKQFTGTKTRDSGKYIDE